MYSIVYMVTQLCPTLYDSMDWSLPGSSAPWDFLGKNTVVGCHFLVHKIFWTQGLNSHFLHLLHCWQILYRLIHHCCSVNKSCPTLWNSMNCSMPDFPVLHHLPEFDQTPVHWVSGTIQLYHPLSSPSPAFNLSQNQGLFSSYKGTNDVCEASIFMT